MKSSEDKSVGMGIIPVRESGRALYKITERHGRSSRVNVQARLADFSSVVYFPRPP